MRNVAVIFLHSRGKVLLQHRAHDAKRASGKWSFFGGGMEEGETPSEAVKRECFEELCYELENPRLIYQGIINKGDMIYVYIEEFDTKRKLVLKEGQDMGWFYPEEVKKLDVIPHDASILLKIQNEL